jgi:hypothetical protein
MCLIVFATGRSQTDFPRIETGVQLSALVLQSPVNGGELGLGARFGYNLTSHFGLEGEANRFPELASLVDRMGG